MSLVIPEVTLNPFRDQQPVTRWFEKFFDPKRNKKILGKSLRRSSWELFGKELISIFMKIRRGFSLNFYKVHQKNWSKFDEISAKTKLKFFFCNLYWNRKKGKGGLGLRELPCNSVGQWSSLKSFSSNFSSNFTEFSSNLILIKNWAKLSNFFLMDTSTIVWYIYFFFDGSIYVYC